MDPQEIEAFLDEPMRMAQVASVSNKGTPLLGSLWFLYTEGRFWFSSHPSSPLVQAAARGIEVAVIVDDFTPPDLIRQVRVRGRAFIEDHRAERVTEIYERYLGPDRTSWPPFFQERPLDSKWALWSVAPDSGVATINPDLRPLEVRWSTPDQSPLAATDR